jgi:hypothetical protein
MKRLLALMIAWAVLAIGIAHAVPARPLYDPPAADPEYFDFRGTVWHGQTYEKTLLTLELDPSGVLNYNYGGNKSTAGSWKSDGNVLYFEMNKKYLEARGTRVGSTIDCDTWNVTGLRWKTHLKLGTPPK